MANLYIFDTSVIIADPYSIKSFPDSEIVIPISVLDEIDKLKKYLGQTGQCARVFMRLLDKISNLGNIDTGILLDNNAIIKVDVNDYPTNFGDRLYGDTRILACAYHTAQNNKHDVILLTNDINLRVRGRAKGIVCQSYDKNEIIASELYSGIQYIENVKAGEKLNKDEYLLPSKYDLKLNINECVIFHNKDKIEIAKGRLMHDGKLKLVPKTYPWSLTPRNNEQELLIDIIMDPNISLVTVAGHAGTGKSIVSIAAALELVLHKKLYSKLIIYRPIQAVGNDLGFLPGEKNEKLIPYFSAVMDNFEVLFSGKTDSTWKKDLEMFQKKGRIELEAITYIRGRSIPNSLIIMDESQNINAKDMKTVLTRVGEGSKIILLGDIEQIDDKDLDASHNGLTEVIERFKGWEGAAHLTLVKGERSLLASKAATVL